MRRIVASDRSHLDGIVWAIFALVGHYVRRAIGTVFYPANVQQELTREHEQAQIHINAARQIIAANGGLDVLGFDGFLANTARG